MAKGPGRRNIIAAVVLGVCLIVAAFLIGGRYSVMRLNEDVIVRLDRWTGQLIVYDCSAQILCEQIYFWPDKTGNDNIENEVMNVDENMALSTSEAISN